MATKPKIPNPNGRKGNPISAVPLTMNQLVDGVFKIKPDDVRRIIASKPGGKKR
ncbi:MAG: hypothetical protein ABSC42_11575 [Tepidisphaeraceae bacterium]|jgi:hypothetical protein